jgi:hypothetical protein
MVLAVPGRYRRRGWTLKYLEKHVIYRPLSVLAAVTSEVSGDGGDEAQDAGGLHAAASH